MKKSAVIISFLSFLIFTNPLIGQEEMTENQKLSYAVGVTFAEQLKMLKIKDVDFDTLIKALDEQLSGKASMELAEAKSLVKNQENYARTMVFEENKLAGEAFLAENAKKSGIVTTESGLQYEVLTKVESGPQPTLQSTVRTHYHGMLIDGTVFDSSVDRGEPISFPLGNVIVGWQEALQLMKVGEKYRVYLPYNLAYGARQAGPTIKPYSALIFEVELLGIE